MKVIVRTDRGSEVLECVSRVKFKGSDFDVFFDSGQSRTFKFHRIISMEVTE